MQYIITQDIMFFDTDIGGVVHNLAYLRMIEVCRTKFAEELGLAMHVMAKTKEYPVVLTTNIQYKKPATLGDQLLITGFLTQIERVKLFFEFKVECAKTKQLFVTCQQSLAIVKILADKTKVLRLPEYIKKFTVSEFN